MSHDKAASASPFRPNVIAYVIAVAIAITTTVFFGWAGFWLGLVVIVLVCTAVWGIPLIKLSYAADSHEDANPKP